MIFAGFAYGHEILKRGSRSISSLVRWAVFIQLPIALVVGFFGNDAVPIVFRPNLGMLELGRDTIVGVPAFAGVFSTQAVASWSFLAFQAILSYRILAQAETIKISRWRFGPDFIAMLSCLVIIYFTTRRGALIVSVVLLLGILTIAKLRAWERALGALLAIALPAFAALSSRIERFASAEVENRAEQVLNLEFTTRITDIFLPLVRDWVDAAPFGSYLGAVGPEGMAFKTATALNTIEVAPVEVGAALIVAETGIMGLFLSCSFIGILLARIMPLLRLRMGEYAGPVLFCFGIFTMFLVKEGSALTTPNVHHMTFYFFLGYGVMLTRKRGFYDKTTDSSSHKQIRIRRR
jgi:hypothetical protein